ncbi:class I SAM-dependent methyltransferase [Actinomadura luteofluorescens]|uniref:class I SAM-dependent methyltransferase n=1 Tax=Actinomadura luteofluorescens TaxID=46163 RepID=UPI002164B908|nr:class I SAM-dependent methyltransferase [Actinomadura glauciflava]
MTGLLDDAALARSSVVANCTMNRERTLSGSNGYGRELGLDVLAEMSARAGGSSPVRWLDLCCGSGRAPAEAAALLAERGLGGRAEIIGLDLVDHFAPGPVHAMARLVSGSVAEWVPDGRFDLITCVHGLHYLGDKLGTLSRIASWLTGDGLFVANFDARSIRHADGSPSGRRLIAQLRAQGFDYDSARRRVSRRGHGQVRFPYRYLGADDQAGPNYTGQPAVDSFYEPIP